VKIFGREPAAVIAAVGSVLTVLATLKMPWFTPGQAAAGSAVLAALILLATTRPVAPSLVTGVVTTGAALFAAYGMSASPELVGGLTAATLAIFALITRQQVSPKETALTSR
jgi:hypothetical protein